MMKRRSSPATRAIMAVVSALSVAATACSSEDARAVTPFDDTGLWESGSEDSVTADGSVDEVEAVDATGEISSTDSAADTAIATDSLPSDTKVEDTSVSLDGEVPPVKPPPPAGAKNSVHPRIVYNAGRSEFGVVYADHDKAFDPPVRHYFVRVDRDGVVKAPPVRFDDWAVETTELVFNGSEYAVGMIGFGYSAFVYRLDQDGKVLGYASKFSKSGGCYVPGSMVWTGTEYLYAYAEGKLPSAVHVARFKTDGSYSDAVVTGIAPLDGCAQVRTSWTGSDLLVAWPQKDPAGVAFKYAHVSASGSVVGSITTLATYPAGSGAPTLRNTPSGTWMLHTNASAKTMYATLIGAATPTTVNLGAPFYYDVLQLTVDSDGRMQMVGNVKESFSPFAVLTTRFDASGSKRTPFTGSGGLEALYPDLTAGASGDVGLVYEALGAATAPFREIWFSRLNNDHSTATKPVKISAD